MTSKAVTKKSGAAQRQEINTTPWKTSAKQNGVRGEGPAARASGKAPFPGVVSGDVAGQETPSRQRTKDYSGGRSDVQPREKGVRY